MDIGDDPGFIALCYCDHGAEVELDTKASIDTQQKASIDEELKAPIDNNDANEIDDFPEGSINSWENDYYQPSFAIKTATPSKRKISAMEPVEYDDSDLAMVSLGS